MSTVRLRIDRLIIDLADASRARDVEPVLRLALELVATKLASTPGDREGTALYAVLDAMQVELASPDLLLGSEGAEHLADELFHRIARSTAYEGRMP